MFKGGHPSPYKTQEQDILAGLATKVSPSVSIHSTGKGRWGR